MRILKRSIALIIACLLVISSMPAVFAEEEIKMYDNFEYIVEDSHIAVIKYIGSASEVVIPEKIENLPVERLGRAFEGNLILTSVRMPDSLKEIGNYAFSSCENLKKVEFGTNTEILGAAAFLNDTSLESVTLPESLRLIKGSAFSSSALKQISIPEGVTSIESYTFFECKSLSEVELNDNITQIKDYAFRGCTSLKTIDLPQNLEFIGEYAFMFCTSLEKCIVPDSVTSTKAGIFKGCSSLKEVNLPKDYTVIPNECFYDCSSLSEWVIPDGITYIGWDSFRGTAVKTMIIPNSVKKTGARAFYECKKLRKVKVPSSLSMIREEDFYGCSALTEVTIEEGVQTVGTRSFADCTSLKSVHLPSTAVNNNVGSFQGCVSLEEINIPEGTVTLYDNMFDGCSSLESITIPEGVKNINEYAFSKCTSLKKIDLPDTVTYCGKGVFENCTNLEGCNLSSKISSINNSLFRKCTSLKSIRIPKTAQAIYPYALVNCPSLRDVYVLNPSIEFKQGCGIGVTDSYLQPDKNLMIFGYSGSTAEKYAANYNLKFFDLNLDISQHNTVINLNSDIIELKQHFTKKIRFTVDDPCGPTRFESTDTSVAVVDGDGVVKGVSIGKAYIAVTNGKATVVVEVNVTEADIDLENGQQNDDYQYYFAEDDNENIYIRITKYIGAETDVVIPSKIEGYPVKEIGEEAFFGEPFIDEDSGIEYDGKLDVESIVIPEGVESLGRAAFYGCLELKSIKFPSTIKYVGNALFYGKNSIVINNNNVSVEFPSVQAYLGFVNVSGDSLQYNLPSQNPYKLIIGGKELNKFELADGVTLVPNYLFYNCKSIESVTLPDGLEAVGKYSFYGCSALKSINIPASVEDIDAYAFYGCASLSEITLPEYLKNLRYHALEGSGIKAITFPANTLVWSYACANCTKLEKIVVNCKAIPDYRHDIFKGCSAVKSIYEGYGVADLNDYQTDYFRGITSKPTGYGYLNGSLIASCRVNGWEFVLLPYPWQTPDSEGSDLDPIDIYPNYLYDAETDTYTMTDKEGSNSGEGAYPNAEAWYAKNVVFDFDKEVCLTQWCTQWIYNVENVIVKGNVLDIDNNAFMFCQNTLKTVELSDNVRMIANGAFNGCDNLTTVKGGKGLKKIGLNAFVECTGLSDISFAESAEQIGRSAFSGCTGLSDFKIPDSVKTIGSCAFVNCSGVDEVEIPATVTEIGEYAIGYMYNSEQAEYYPIPGFTVITVKGSAGEKYALENDFKIEYTKESNPADKPPGLSATKYTLAAGKVKTLRAYNCTVKSWKSSNSKVVTVNSGKITALKKGTATITATLTTGKKLTCKVTVSTSPKLSKKTVSVKKGRTVSVKITGKAAAVNNVYTNTKYAKVVSKNNAATIIVKGLKKGTTTLKIKVNGVVLKLKVKVK